MKDSDNKSRWDKTAIILQPLGGFLTALVVAILGISGTAALSQHQARETAAQDRRQAKDVNVRLYADLMSKREAADSELRKGMFESIVKTFLEPKSSGAEQKVLGLELLAYNFHESLDLSPLFRHVYRSIDPHSKDSRDHISRLERVAKEVSSRQIAALETPKGKLDGTVVFEDIEKNLENNVPVMEGLLTMHVPDVNPKLQERYFRVDALYVDRKRKELRLQLNVRTPNTTGKERAEEIDDVSTTFWVGSFDFPLIDNTRLSHGQRCALAFTDFTDSRAHLTLIYFPGSHASLKEKPYYDEIIDSLHEREAARP